MTIATAKRIAHTTDMDREAWLRARRQGIGSSDAAAVAGLNPWSSPAAVWLDKTGRSKDNEQNEFMYFGTLLEPIVADEFTRRTERKVRRCNYILQHPEHPFMLANIDREVVGEKAILECKTTSAWNADEWDGEQAPLQYIVQVQHQLAVLGPEYTHGYFAVLIGGNDFRHYRIDRDDELIANLVTIEREFWGYVERDEMPPADGADSTRAALAAMVPDPLDEEIELAPDAAALFRQYDEAASDEKAAGKRKSEASQRLAQLLGDYKAGTYTIGDKRRKVQWVTRKGNVNWSAIVRDYGVPIQDDEIDDYRGAPSRSIRIS